MILFINWVYSTESQKKGIQKNRTLWSPITIIEIMLSYLTTDEVCENGRFDSSWFIKALSPGCISMSGNYAIIHFENGFSPVRPRTIVESNIHICILYP